MKRANRKKGFTIVELVIVIGVIGILSAILIPTFVNVTANANAAALQSNIANVYSAYAAEAADGEVDASTTSPKAAIVFKAQADVAIKFETKTYEFNGTSKKWEAKENTDRTTLVSTTEAYSTFNGGVVYYKAA